MPPSKFLGRTWSNLNEQKACSTGSQLTELQLHPTLEHERQDLAGYLAFAEKIRGEAKTAEAIRSRVKRMRDKMLIVASSLRECAEANVDLKSELDKISVEIQFAQCSVNGDSDRPVSSSSSRAESPSDHPLHAGKLVSKLGGELKRWSSGLSSRSSEPVCAKRVVPNLSTGQVKTRLLGQFGDAHDVKSSVFREPSLPTTPSEVIWSSRYGDSSNAPALREAAIAAEQSRPIEDLHLLVYLMRTVENLQDVLANRVEILGASLEDDVCGQLTDYVKTDLKEARQEGRNFFQEYGTYQDAVKQLNSYAKVHFTENGPRSTSPLNTQALKQFLHVQVAGKQYDEKKFQQMTENLQDSKEQLSNRTESSLIKLGEAEFEWEAGVVPYQMLQYIKEIRSFFEKGLKDVDELFPAEMVELLETNYKARHSRAFNEPTLSVETPPLTHRGRSETKETISLHAPSPPIVSRDHSSNVFFPKQAQTGMAPSFAPPPPPVKDCSASSAPPLPSIPPPAVPILPPYSPPCSPPSPPGSPNPWSTPSIEFPKGLSSTTRDLLERFTDPECRLLYSVLASDSSIFYRKFVRSQADSQTDCLSVPTPLHTKHSGPPSSFDAIQRAIKLVQESGKLIEWTGVLWDRWGSQILQGDLSSLEKGDVVWILETKTKADLVRIIQYHIIFTISRHYLQKCLHEIVTCAVKTCKASETIDSVDWNALMRQIWKIILGHRGLVPKSMKTLLDQRLQRLSTGEFDDVELKRHQAIALIMFYQLLLPALSGYKDLIEFWSIESHLPAGGTDFKALAEEIRNVDVDDHIKTIGLLLRLTLSVALEIPQDTETSGELHEIRWQILAEQLAKDNASSFADYFAIISKAPDALHNQKPDSWMMDMWSQEWEKTYLNN